MSKTYDRQKALDMDQAKEADEKKSLADNIVIREVPIGKVSKHPGHVRQNTGNIDTLQESIDKTGLQEPISVVKRPNGEGSYTFDGGRRLKACTNLNHKTIACIEFENLSDEEAAKKSFIINDERETLKAMDKAKYVGSLLNKRFTQEQAAIYLGLGSAAMINNYKKLLGLPEAVTSEIDSKISMAQALDIFRLPSKESQEEMAKKIIKKGWSRKQARAYIQSMIDKANSVLPEPAENIPTDNPGLIRRRQTETPEQPEGSMHVGLSYIPVAKVKTGTKGDFLNTMQPVLDVIADARSKIRTGGIFGLIFPETYSSSGRSNDNPDDIRLVGSLFHPTFTNHGYKFKGKVLINIIDDDDVERHHKETSKATHTEYNIHKCIFDLHIYEGKGDKDPSSQALEQKSRPDDEDLKSWTEPIWTFNVKECGGIDAVKKEIAKRFIRLYSNVGDSILDPFVTNQAVFKAALETDRIPTGYIFDELYNPDDWKELFGDEVDAADFAEADESDLSSDVGIADESSSIEEPKAMHFTNDATFVAGESSNQESL
jgi:ParB/RepB/Spo0J family partition protein